MVVRKGKQLEGKSNNLMEERGKRKERRKNLPDIWKKSLESWF
jgi:hypothetical protein